MKFEKNVFEKFHNDFSGDNEETFSTCLKCGGACEYNKVSSLLPGEVEFMANKMNITVHEFKSLYLDGVEVDGEVIDIIKCSEPCPFLNKDYSCDVKEFKPIMCLIYPIIFEPDGLNWKAALDDACPLAQNTITKQYFQDIGIKLVDKLNIPNDWIKRIYKFDEFDFDYTKMVEERDISINEYKIYTLEELLSYRIK